MSASSLTMDQRAVRESPSARREQPRASSDLDLLASLRTWFQTDFHLVDGETGEVLRQAPEQQAINFTTLGQLCRAVAVRGCAELLDEEEPLLVLAIPACDAADHSRVAVGIFVAASQISAAGLSRAALKLGLSPEEAVSWIVRQSRWTARNLISTGQLAAERIAVDGRLVKREAESRAMSAQLSTTHEEISLLDRLIRNLRLTTTDKELVQLALGWLADLLPAESLAARLKPPDCDGAAGCQEHRKGLVLTQGRCPLDADDLTRLVEGFALGPGQKSLIVNPPATQDAGWQWPGIREMVVVSIGEGEGCCGWLAAFNHTQGGPFGSLEVDLLSSVGATLGVHRANAELYEQQHDLLTAIVGALSSAVDGRDPHNCGHSDRVARVAVRLAEELGCDRKQVETVYLAALLHDVGKIGVDEKVLCKPGKLTDTEFEHIKTHAEIGCRILSDVRQLDDVLPVVLHHHERWDGRGYPSRLAGEKIPLLARIVAVADAFDAMSSNRAYRQGMSDETLDSILRDEAGKQWDAAVVDAFFRARDDIRRIAHEAVSRVKPDVPE